MLCSPRRCHGPQPISVPCSAAHVCAKPTEVLTHLTVLQLHRSPDGDGLFLHQDIREGRKQAGGAGGHLKLGTPLTIHVAGSAEPLTFEDLDDVIANFAEPYLENVKALVSDHQRAAYHYPLLWVFPMQVCIELSCICCSIRRAQQSFAPKCRPPCFCPLSFTQAKSQCAARPWLRTISASLSSYVTSAPCTTRPGFARCGDTQRLQRGNADTKPNAHHSHLLGFGSALPLCNCQEPQHVANQCCNRPCNCESMLAGEASQVPGW